MRYGILQSMLAALLLAAIGLFAAGCHTVEGAGRDLQSIGGGVEEGADELRMYE